MDKPPSSDSRLSSIYGLDELVAVLLLHLVVHHLHNFLVHHLLDYRGDVLRAKVRITFLSVK